MVITRGVLSGKLLSIAGNGKETKESECEKKFLHGVKNLKVFFFRRS